MLPPAISIQQDMAMFIGQLCTVPTSSRGVHTAHNSGAWAVNSPGKAVPVYVVFATVKASSPASSRADLGGFSRWNMREIGVDGERNSTEMIWVGYKENLICMAFAYRGGRSKYSTAYHDRIRESRLPLSLAYRGAFCRGAIAYRDESTSLFFDFVDTFSLVLDLKRLS
ncbi:hypothetical protein E3N88_17689 [Mikania micrantha]|uniref:Uncharacterized protein n=1 Tax=Mikania micrantha TaxID=192012 RepID=A0A5N6NUD0_9ASTR|nr:hypothetical protein E3N88_17689 [Mikania micrantha]